LFPNLSEHEFPEWLDDRGQRVLLADLIVHHRLQSVLPCAVEGRRHDKERHEQRQTDEDEIGRRALQPRPERRNESATMKRVKLVTMMRRPGATDSTVRIATISMMRPLAVAPPAGIRALRSTDCADAGALAAKNATTAPIARLIA